MSYWSCFRNLCGVIFLVACFAATASADVLRRFTHEKLGLSLATADSGYQLVLHYGDPAARISADVFAIENPTRLVIDVFGARVGSARETTVSDSVVRRIRIGTHREKVRVVLDLSRPMPPKFSLTNIPAENGAVVKFHFTGPDTPSMTQASRIPPIVSEPRSPTASSPTVSRPFIESPPRPTAPQTRPIRTPVAPRPQTVAPPSSTVPEPPTTSTARSAPAAATVSAISFAQLPQANESGVKITLLGQSSYVLTQKSATEYALVIDSARLAGNHLSLAQFPPETIKGFELVSASETADGKVSVRMFTTPNMSLVPFRVQETLWVKAIAK